MVAIDQLWGIFSKVAYNLHQPLDPPQKQPVTKYAPLPHQVRPTRSKPIPSKRPNIIEDDDGKITPYLQRKVHISRSGPHIILPDVPVSPTNVRPVQHPRVYTGGAGSNLRSSCKKNPVSNFALLAQFMKVIEANPVTHQISVVA